MLEPVTAVPLLRRRFLPPEWNRLMDSPTIDCVVKSFAGSPFRFALFTLDEVE